MFENANIGVFAGGAPPPQTTPTWPVPHQAQDYAAAILDFVKKSSKFSFRCAKLRENPENQGFTFFAFLCVFTFALFVVSLLLLANMFLGIYYNLSIWYKLIEKTIFGAYLSIFGAIITLSLNIVLIPKIGFVGSAITTFLCYFSMVIASYFLGKKHFFVPYKIKSGSLYLLSMLGIYYLIYNEYFNLGINTLLLLGFMIFVYLLERPIRTNKITKP